MPDRSFDIHFVNAFSMDPEGGNPAAVCLLDRWPDDDVLRHIGMTTGPSVTAFVLPPENGEFPLRWFTRGGREVRSFCGHATFAAAHVLAQADPSLDRFSFRAVSGQFLIRLEGGKARDGSSRMELEALCPARCVG